VYVTVCTAKRRSILDHNYIHELLVEEAWPKANHWMVGRYGLMPDHIHLFCSPSVENAVTVKRWVAYWKSYASNHWPTRTKRPIWQQDCWDRQLRSGESYDEKWAYVKENPVRHGLVESAKDWPYQGELHVLDWHDG